MKKIVKNLFFIWALVLFMAQSVMAANVYEFTLSVDTVMDHPRNQGVLIFIKNFGGKIQRTIES